MRPRHLVSAFLYSLILATQAASAAGPARDASLIERGKYLAQVGGCNDCHTPGYMPSEGKVPMEQWLTGTSVGFQGPWGTTYPANLRLYMHSLSEAQWLARARQPMRPPMPWFNLSLMTDRDLIALYRFVRSMGPAGEPAPHAAQPGEAVSTPYFEFVPKNLPQPAQHAKR